MSNPVLTENAAKKFMAAEGSFQTAAVSGVVLKTAFLFAVLFTASMYTFSLVASGFTDRAVMLGTAGLFGGFIMAMVIIFSKNEALLAPFSILYAALEGLFIGGLSAMFAGSFGMGLVINAAMATFGTLLAMLFLYSAKIIKCTEKFKSTVILGTFAILVVYLVTFIVGLFNPLATSALMGNGLLGIGFSILVCFVAALNLIIDFSMIENAKNMGLNKSFEWYGAFSLMVTLVWLYIEILKLLSKFASRE